MERCSNEQSKRISQDERTQPEFKPHPDLNYLEVWWYQRYEWFKERGYLLRDRYAPGWSPSWIKTGKSRWDAADGLPAAHAAQLLDATRISDGAYVVLKRVKKRTHRYEVEIAQFLSSATLAGASDNHSVPIYEVLRRVPADEEIDIIVMPLLIHYIEPLFDTIGEAVECFRQLFEGLLFMHKHRVAHRDCTSFNVMVDPTTFYLDPFHPVHSPQKRDFSGLARYKTRTEGRPKYIYIDFGLSLRYDDSVPEPKAHPVFGGDKEVPEFQNSKELYDPFATDVFYIANMIRKDIIEETKGLEFMRPLIADMIQEDPSKRPTMEQVVDRFKVIQAGLKTGKLRSRLPYRDEGLFGGVVPTISHWIRRIRFMFKGVPALPTPSSSVL